MSPSTIRLNSTRCSVANCAKKAQSRRLCIAHGGGTYCQSQNCQKLTQSHGLCAHGGRRRCAMDNCGKLSQHKGLRLARGGGRRCSVPDCQKFRQIRARCKRDQRLQIDVLVVDWLAALVVYIFGMFLLPTLSGTIKFHLSLYGTSMPTPAPRRKSTRCSVPDCTKKSQTRRLCKAHGGGIRCSIPNCQKLAQSGRLCVAHGGGHRCTVDGCGKLSQYKGLCLAHGGGRRCSVQDCQKFRQIRDRCKAHAKTQAILPTTTPALSTTNLSGPNSVVSKLSISFLMNPLVPVQTTSNTQLLTTTTANLAAQLST